MPEAAALCWANHAVAVAAIWGTFDKVKSAAGERYDERIDAAKDKQKARDYVTLDRYRDWKAADTAWHSALVALINEDCEICLERVIHY